MGDNLGRSKVMAYKVAEIEVALEPAVDADPAEPNDPAHAPPPAAFAPAPGMAAEIRPPGAEPNLAGAFSLKLYPSSPNRLLMALCDR